jgi:hypothetical protein
MEIKENVLVALINVIILTSIIFLVSYFFMNNKSLIGIMLILLGFVCLIPLWIFKIKLRSIRADIIFGMIDNGILVIFALIGAELFGVLGAIVGGAVGNAITDGFAGVFEGYEAQKMRNKKIEDKRTVISAAIGKMAGCMFAAGIVLTIAWLILALF